MIDLLRILNARLRQGHRTIDFPGSEPALPPRFRGLPVIQGPGAPGGAKKCADACPTGALAAKDERLSLDLGRCIFCGDCAAPELGGLVKMSTEFRLSARRRDDLIVDSQVRPAVEALDAAVLRMFGRSLRLRQVSAGGCNGCEVEASALQNVVFDFSRFGIQFVASPRHADGLLITGPVTKNMELALRKTYAAVPSPKIVIAAGACAISGGPFAGHPAVLNGAVSTVPVDLFIAGCPPHPLTMLDGLLRLLGRIEGDPERGPPTRRP